MLKAKGIRKLLWALLFLSALLGLACFWMVQPFVRAANTGTFPQADPQQLQKHVEFLSVDCAPRDYTHPANLDRAAAYIKKVLQNTGASVSDQVFRTDGQSYQNIRARIGSGSRQRIVVGAHYDSCGELPGADDNASGVAAVLELARLLKERPLNSDVEIVAYTLEEPPYFRTESMGSAVHAGSLKSERVDLRLMISVEMVGYFSDSKGSQGYPLPLLKLVYPSEGNFISLVGTIGNAPTVRRVKALMKGASSLPVASINAPRWIPGIDFSDQLNYWDAGFNAVMITDTAFYRNEAYHTSDDTFDRLNYQKMAMVVQQLLAVCLHY